MVGVTTGVLVQVAVGVREGPPGVTVGVVVDTGVDGVGVKTCACWWVIHNSGSWVVVSDSLLANLTSPIAPEERSNRP